MNRLDSPHRLWPPRCVHHGNPLTHRRKCPALGRWQWREVPEGNMPESRQSAWRGYLSLRNLCRACGRRFPGEPSATGVPFPEGYAAGDLRPLGYRKPPQGPRQTGHRPRRRVPEEPLFSKRAGQSTRPRGGKPGNISSYARTPQEITHSLRCPRIHHDIYDSL